MVAPERVRLLNESPARAGAAYVLYWAQINRRLDSNQGLAFAVETANRLGLPVLIYEGLTWDHEYAGRRFESFILDGVPDNASRAEKLGLGYVFYHRAVMHQPNDMVYQLAKEAAALVTDDFPCYMARNFNTSVPAKIGIPYYVVDSSCIVPMECLPKQEYAAYTIRPKLLRLLNEYLHPVKMERVKHQWKGAPAEIPLASATGGGRTAALKRLDEFLEHDLVRYAKHNREPSRHATSRLSPFLHFGHISSLEIALAARKHAEENRLLIPEFLEQLIVRRELAFNFARRGPDPHSLEALPEWAQQTLAKHAFDQREWVYKHQQFERAETHDELWNATQRELLRDGVIHGYYRMYWGKKILEWSATHQSALDTMIYLNDRYALDGRDPNTYANILWCFGLHDRPWMERPIFGMIRYMNLAGMRRKTDVDAYVREMQ
jgi:deoxyribodipyrimidine photo-lyase